MPSGKADAINEHEFYGQNLPRYMYSSICKITIAIFPVDLGVGYGLAGFKWIKHEASCLAKRGSRIFQSAIHAALFGPK